MPERPLLNRVAGPVLKRLSTWNAQCMSALAFDTLKTSRALKEAGFGEARAEAVAAAVGSALGGNIALKTAVAALRAELEARLYRHLRIMAAGIVVVTVTLVKLIP